jgi:ferrochelatase
VYASHVAETIKGEAPDHFVFSFHSLPVRHLKRLDASGEHCAIKLDCCREITAANKNCYRAQCVFTARAMAEKLGLSKDTYSVSFQSRLGRAEWIGPQTEDRLRELAGEGIKRVAVACPSFVADCLETVEEIALRAREVFIQAGGEELRLIPSLNSNPAWVDSVVGWIRESEPC